MNGTLVQRHEREFRDSEFASERELYRVRALIGLSRHDDAVARVEQFRREHPRSPYLDRLNRLLAN